MDGVPDWEESLWGTDPTKRDTNDDGMSDGVEIENFKKQTGKDETPIQDDSKLTETDKFSREFFATVTTLNQNGQMDQATIDKLSSSLVEHIENSPPRRVFSFSDLKIIKDDSIKAIKGYNDTLNKINKKYPTKTKVIDVLEKMMLDANDVDVSVLPELDPSIENTRKTINDMVNMSVPQSLASLHLDLVNSLQRLMENISDIKLYDSDIVVALSAISQYNQNALELKVVFNNLEKVLKQKLSS